MPKNNNTTAIYIICVVVLLAALCSNASAESWGDLARKVAAKKEKSECCVCKAVCNAFKKKLYPQCEKYSRTIKERQICKEACIVHHYNCYNKCEYKRLKNNKCFKQHMREKDGCLDRCESDNGGVLKRIRCKRICLGDCRIKVRECPGFRPEKNRKRPEPTSEAISEDKVCFENGNELKEAVKKYIKSKNPKKSKVAEKYGYPINEWCVEKVTQMEELFADTDFNSNIADWDVSSVTSMKGMFRNNPEFDKPLKKWDVSNVENMNEMFAGATSFDKPLSKWDVGSVKKMKRMFEGATSFSQNLCDWADHITKQTKLNDMFKDTSCDDDSDPIIKKKQSKSGPFCSACDD